MLYGEPYIPAGNGFVGLVLRNACFYGSGGGGLGGLNRSYRGIDSVGAVADHYHYRFRRINARIRLDVIAQREAGQLVVSLTQIDNDIDFTAFVKRGAVYTYISARLMVGFVGKGCGCAVGELFTVIGICCARIHAQRVGFTLGHGAAVGGGSDTSDQQHKNEENRDILH